MNRVRLLLLKFFTWFFWRQFHWGLKSVLGHESIAASIREMKAIEYIIRYENNLGQADKITWENSKMTDRETFARYYTLKHFNEVGELLAFFHAIDKKKILGVN